MYRKKELCHGSKITVLSMHSCYLATEFICDTSHVNEMVGKPCSARWECCSHWLILCLENRGNYLKHHCIHQKTLLKKVGTSSTDDCSLICGINFKLSARGSFFNTSHTAGLMENLTLPGKSPDFPLSSCRVCKTCKRKLDSVMKRKFLLQQDSSSHQEVSRK